MQRDLGAAAGRARHIACEELGSTNAHALELARAGERGPLWITARRQTAGRGRRSRAWVSIPGNLHASLLLIDPAPGCDAAGISFVAALAVHDAIAGLRPALRPCLSLKWPNDVLVAGAKAAGILIEAETVEAGLCAVVVGIGVNCASYPSGTDYPATSLAASGASLEPETLFHALASAMARRLAEWEQGANFASIRKAWIARAAGFGGAIQVRLGSREIDGVFETLDAGGRLVLRLPDGRSEAIAAGDVFGLPAAVPGPSEMTVHGCR